MSEVGCPSRWTQQKDDATVRVPSLGGGNSELKSPISRFGSVQKQLVASGDEGGTGLVH